MTDGFPRALDQPVALVNFIENYLHRLEAQIGAHPNSRRKGGNLYDFDREWSNELSGERSALPAFVAIAQLEASRQHLRAVSALLPLDDVDQPVLACSRACVEASARALFVLDPEVTPSERFARALNESWEVASSQKATGKEARAGLTNLAARLGIDFQMKQRSARFGALPRPSMSASLRRGLATIGYPEDTFEKFLPFLNGAAHAGMDAGLLTFAIQGDATQVGQVARCTAALAALAAFGQAQTASAKYQGYPPIGESGLT